MDGSAAERSLGDPLLPRDGPRLLPLVEQSGAATVALIGLGKNVGKTTLFNRLVTEARARGIPLGLTSVGRDGEERDALTFKEKPRIRAPRGTMALTTEGSLGVSSLRWEEVADTGIHTPLGRLLLVRALEDGIMELTGPMTTGQLRATLPLFAEHGAALTLVDGAFDRTVAAAPTLTDASMLAVGAALESRLDYCLDIIRFRLDLLRRPAVNPALASAVETTINRREALLVEGSDAALGLRLPLTPTLAAGTALGAALGPATSALILGTALTTPLVEGIMSAKPRPLEVVVADSTRLLVTRDAWQRFSAWGASVTVAHPIRLLLVAANPYSPYGWRFDPDQFLDLVGQAAAPCPVVDVVAGLCSH